MTPQRRFLLTSLLGTWVGMAVACGGGGDREETIPKKEQTDEAERAIESLKASRARIDCQALSSQVEIYKLNNGKTPTSVDQLTQVQPNGDPPLVQPDKIKDPWGKKYQLDTTRPATLGTRVFTTIPWGETISSPD